jgi:hypothetical protein
MFLLCLDVGFGVTCGRRPGKDIPTFVQHWSGAVTCPASHEGYSVKGFVSMLSEGALILQGFPANLTSGGTVIPTTVPHSGLESSRRTTPLCEDGGKYHAGQR